MSEFNPFLQKPLPETDHVVTIVHEAISDWQQRTIFPYPMAGAREVVEIRSREAFYIQQIVRKVLQENREQIDAFLEHVLKQ